MFQRIPSYTSLSSTHRLVSRSVNIPINDFLHFDYIAVQLNTDIVADVQALDQYAASLENEGMYLLGRVGELNDYYYYAVNKREALTSGHATDIVERVKQRAAVSWAQLQRPRKLERRAMVEKSPSEKRLCEQERLKLRSMSENNTVHTRDALPGMPLRNGLFNRLNIKDPEFPKQWHLYNREVVGNDINVTSAWESGITGKNVTVCFIDDGLDSTHEDIKDKFYAEGSYDFNDHRKLPKPTVPEDRHGTRCAGEVAAARNDVCGVGVAWDAKVSGVRILSGDLTEADEAAAIVYDYHNNHIYSCSWGPSDNGQAMDAPPKIVADAFKDGIIRGRNGLGSLYVFATGNGGASFDNCNFDGYTNSIYTITVGAIDSYNNHPSYSEECSAQMVVTYSSGSGNYIHTSDWPYKCTDHHGGTSAAAPLASGIYALVMSVRPDFSWRDFQHVSVQSAIPVALDDKDWQDVAMGRKYSHRFGFGKLDSYRIIELSKRFKNVGPQTNITSHVIYVDKPLPHSAEGVTSSITITNEDVKKANMMRMEHVTVTVNISHGRRGEVQVLLTSPHNYTSILATRRPLDESLVGFIDWTFMSVKHWEEDPVGEWKLTVFDSEASENTGRFINWKLTLFGEQYSIQNETKTPTIFAAPTSSLTIPSSTSVPKLNGTSILPSPNSSASFNTFIFVGFLAFVAVVGLGSLFFWRRKKMTSDPQYHQYAFQELDEHKIMDTTFGAPDEEEVIFNRDEDEVV